MKKIQNIKEFYETHRNQILGTYYEIIEPGTLRELFYDTCFTIMVPGGSYESTLRGLEAVKAAGLFEHRDVSDIKKVIKYNRPGWKVFKSHVRFPNQKYERLNKFAKDSWDKIKDTLFFEAPFCEYSKAKDIREELKKEVDGFGYKASSHILRNQGAQGLAIIDTHIKKYEDQWSCLDTTSYKRNETMIREWCCDLNIPPHIMDITIWTFHSGNYDAIH